MQTSKQRNSEKDYRRKVLEQRRGVAVFDEKYKYGEKDYYLTTWVLPQISRFRKLLSVIGEERLNNTKILELGAESGHISSFICNNFKP